MTPWRPTEGLKRAEDVVAVLEQDYANSWDGVKGVEPGPVQFLSTYRHRMVAVIAKALDHALADGAEQDALASVMVANGSRPAPDPIENDYSVTAEGVGAAPGSEYAGFILPYKAETAPKKGRGRPKGAKGKKKAKAKAATVEAPEAEA